MPAHYEQHKNFGRDAVREPTVFTRASREKTLYIGRLDFKVSEYMLIKQCQPHGAIERVNYLWHHHGENRGTPRGFAFVEYKTKAEAVLAQKALDGKQILSKQIMVRFAEDRDASEYNNFSNNSSQQRNTYTQRSGHGGHGGLGAYHRRRYIDKTIPIPRERLDEGLRANQNQQNSYSSSSNSQKTTPAPLSKSAKIRAIEEKLRKMRAGKSQTQTQTQSQGSGSSSRAGTFRSSATAPQGTSRSVVSSVQSRGREERRKKSQPY